MKGLEALSRVESFVGYNYCSTDLLNEMATLSKELKALEIIKNKRVDVEGFKEALGNASFLQLETYNNWVFYDEDRMLIQEEWDLLTEVFTDEQV